MARLEGEGPNSHDVPLQKLGIGTPMETIKKDVEKITEIINERG
jgi:hypothetical protein